MHIEIKNIIHWCQELNIDKNGGRSPLKGNNALGNHSSLEYELFFSSAHSLK